MDRIKIKGITARMVSDMMARVINLNSNAPEDVFYAFEFAGCVNSVTFTKYREGAVVDSFIGSTELVTVFHEYAYLDRGDDLGHPLSAIEQLIAYEELLQREGKK